MSESMVKELVKYFWKSISKMSWEDWCSTSSSDWEGICVGAILDLDLTNYIDEVYECFDQWYEGIDETSFLTLQLLRRKTNMMPTMTREEFDSMSFEELLDWAYDNIDNMHSEEVLIDLVKHEIDEDSFKMALHILQAIYDSNAPDGCYYIYDRSMGTLETPTPITCKEDLEEYIDFEDGDLDEEDKVADYIERWELRDEVYEEVKED